jgi:putative protease
MKLFVKSDEALLKALLKKDIDGVILGIHPYAQRMRESYTPDKLESLAAQVKASGKALWLSLNAIIHEGDIEALEYIFEKLVNIEFDGLLFTDLSVVKLAETYGLKDLLIYDSETYVTNSEDVQFWENQGIREVVGARQLTIEDIETLASKSTMPFAMQLHGYVNMFHSARKLVETFFEHQGEDTPEKHNEEALTMVEKKRPEDPYPVYQDAFGTHVFRSKPMHAFNVFERVKASIDTFIVSTVLYEKARVLSIVDDLILANNEGVDDVLLKRYTDHDEGFLHKKTVYKQGGDQS